MSAINEKPCAVCQSAPEVAGDFGDYLQCTNDQCSQRALALHESVWPKVMTEEEKENVRQEGGEQ